MKYDRFMFRHGGSNGFFNACLGRRSDRGYERSLWLEGSFGSHLCIGVEYRRQSHVEMVSSQGTVGKKMK